MSYTGLVYAIKVKDEFKKSANILSLDQSKFINYVYVGATDTSLQEAYKQHKSKLNKHKSKIFMELFGESNLEIVLIKEYEVLDKGHLEIYVILYMNRLRYQDINILNNTNYEIKPDCKYNCKYCNYRTDYKKDFVKHLKSKEHLNLRLGREEESNLYTYNHNCEYCNYRTDRSDKYNDHLKTKSHMEKSGEEYIPTYKCELCNYSNCSKKNYSKHLKTKSHISKMSGV